MVEMGVKRAESSRAHARPPLVARAPTYTSARASRAQISTIQSARIAKTKSQARSRTLLSRKSWLRSMLDNATKTNWFSKEEARLSPPPGLFFSILFPPNGSPRAPGGGGGARLPLYFFSGPLLFRPLFFKLPLSPGGAGARPSFLGALSPGACGAGRALGGGASPFSFFWRCGGRPRPHAVSPSLFSFFGGHMGGPSNPPPPP